MKLGTVIAVMAAMAIVAGPGLVQAQRAPYGPPIVTEGKTVGAIGMSGATSEQDGPIASAGAAALK